MLWLMLLLFGGPVLAYLQAPAPPVAPELFLQRSAHRWEWERQWGVGNPTLTEDLAAVYESAEELEVVYFDAGQVRGFCVPVLRICEAYIRDRTSTPSFFGTWRFPLGLELDSALAEFVKQCSRKLAAARNAPIRPVEPHQPPAPSRDTRYFDSRWPSPPPESEPVLSYRTTTLRWKPTSGGTDPPAEVVENLREAAIRVVSGRRSGCGTGQALIPKFALEDPAVLVFFDSGPGPDEGGCDERGIMFLRFWDGSWSLSQFTFRPEEIAWFESRIRERLLLTVEIP